MAKPTQHYLTNTVTIDGVAFRLPKGYESSDGKTVHRNDGGRLIPRQTVCVDGKHFIYEGMSAVPANGLKPV